MPHRTIDIGDRPSLPTPNELFVLENAARTAQRILERLNDNHTHKWSNRDRVQLVKTLQPIIDLYEKI